MELLLIPHFSKEPVVLRNLNCCYCGLAVSDGADSKEHVIGRNFVPKGTLAGEWNLILRACAKCNGEKAALEDDISSITMQPDGYGEFVNDDSRLQEAASRKAKSFSRRTKKPVAQSCEDLNIALQPSPNVTMSFGLKAPVQIDEQRALDLALFQTQGFFFHLTFNPKSRQGGFVPGTFGLVMISRKSDWGNVVMREFGSLAKAWLPRFRVTTAKNYFRALIKKHPSHQTLWAWALEWNQNFRLIGFFGEPDALQAEIGRLPHLDKKYIQQGKEIYRYWQEIRLAAQDDLLFEI
jgi:hypothetical protein